LGMGHQWGHHRNMDRVAILDRPEVMSHLWCQACPFPDMMQEPVLGVPALVAVAAPLILVVRLLVVRLLVVRRLVVRRLVVHLLLVRLLVLYQCLAEYHPVGHHLVCKALLPRICHPGHRRAGIMRHHLALARPGACEGRLLLARMIKIEIMPASVYRTKRGNDSKH